MALVITLGWNKIQSLKQDNKELVEDVRTLTDSVNLLISATETTDMTLGTLMAKSEAQLKLLGIQNKHLTNLRESNADIKAFLGLSTPGDISGMLNNARTRTNGTTDTSGLVTKESFRIGGSSP